MLFGSYFESKICVDVVMTLLIFELVDNIIVILIWSYYLYYKFICYINWEKKGGSCKFFLNIGFL